MPPRAQPVSRLRGSVLVIVLVTIVFTTAALLVLMERATDDLLIPTRDADARRLRVEAYSALETVVGVLEDFRIVNNGLHSSAEGWQDPLVFAGYEPKPGRTIEVSFIDESGKLSLPAATEQSLKDLFKVWEVPPTDSDKLVDSLLTWMKKDHAPITAGVTRAEDYERDPLPFLPPGRSLRNWAELASIDGVREVFFDEEGNPTELGKRFTEAFSLYKFDKPNVNAVVGDTLQAVGGYDEFQRNRLIEYVTGEGAYAHKGPGFFNDVGEVSRIASSSGQTTGGEFGTTISALWIVVTVREGRGAFQLRALIAPKSGGATIPEAGTYPGSIGANAGQTTTSAASTAAGTTGGQTARATTGGSTGGTNTGTATAAGNLNYPFTVLEIHENDVIAPAPPPVAPPLP